MESTIPFIRPTARVTGLRPLAEHGARLARYTPPFSFTSFFAPEDTLLCLLAGQEALRRTGPAPRIVELTAGSGLVGLALVEASDGAMLYGVDIDPSAVPIAEANAELLGLGDRARFAQRSLWHGAMARELADEGVTLLVCNPPYIPEPPDGRLPIEAGSGPDGADHVNHVLALAATARPAVLVLSWCSLCDPAGVVARAAALGYRLETLFLCAIADGEYAGMVHDYLRTLPSAVLSESAATVSALAPDGSARFGYLLLAGVFLRERTEQTGDTGPGRRVPDVPAVTAMEATMRGFARDGLDALARIDAPFDARPFFLDRWDEIALRAMLHGAIRP